MSKRRLDMKLLQKDVAGILGVDTTTINNWERNRNRPKLYLIPKIVQFLGHTPFSKEKPTLIEAMKTYRLMHGLSQRKMARILRIDPTTLARWENGKAMPSNKLGRRLSDLLDEPDLGISTG